MQGSVCEKNEKIIWYSISKESKNGDLTMVEI